MNEKVAKYDMRNRIAFIKTNKETRVGPQRLVLERCAKDGSSIVEVTMDFLVEKNTAPKFSLPIEQKFVIDGK